MGGIFHLFDFHQGSMARKILAKKKQVDGFETPRNRLELQLDPSQSNYAAGDLPCSYQVEEEWSARNYYQAEASMKKLISEEMSKQANTRHNAPSIVARLMGMDLLPSDTKSVVPPVVKTSDNRRAELSGREKNVKGSNLYHSRQMGVDCIYSTRDIDADRWNANLTFGKPRPREHPQEEELQRFKKEFEAWQVARIRECTKVVDVGSIYTLQLPQEKQNKERKALYADSVQTMREQPLESKRFEVNEKDLQRKMYKSELFTSKKNEPRRRSTIKDFPLHSMIDYNEKVLDAAPTRIVILRPGPDGIYDHEESWTSSPSSFQERVSMEDFLEEVRERLKSELQGKALGKKKSSEVRGSGIETPFSEKPSADPRQIAKHIAKQVRENVSRELGMNFLLSESTRSYRSESYNADDVLAKDILSGPTVMMNFGKSHENPTEVPPSPASVCSSPHEEVWGEVDYRSPISTPDVTLREDNVAPLVFREISTNFNELRRQLNELESAEADHITIEQEPTESETVFPEDHGQGYVRDLLVASVLFDGSCDKSLSRWDPLAKPISESVFEQVEEYYRKSPKENEKKVDCKLLLDLSNEALATVLGPLVTMSKFRRNLLGSTILTPPQGRKLLNFVWEIVHTNLHPPNDRYNYSLDNMVANLGKEVEWYIIGDLVEEVVKDMHS